MNNRRLHPYFILESFPRFALISLLPFLQSVLTAPLSGRAWKSFLWAASPFLPAVLLYLTASYSHRSCFLYTHGLFFRRREILPDPCISTAELRTTVFSSLTGASLLRLNTPSGRGRSPSIQIPVPAFRLWKQHRIRKVCFSHKRTFSPLHILLVSASWSNAASGLLFTGILLQRTGSILGEEFSRPVYDTVSQGFRIAVLGIPPVVTGIGVLLAAGWLIALFRDFSLYFRFTVRSSPRYLLFSRGLFTHRQEYVKKSCLRAVMFRQTLLLYFLHTGVISLLPEGKSEKHADFFLLPELCRDPFPRNTIHPSRRAVKSYLLLPCFLAVSLLGLFYICHSVLLSVVAFPLLLPCLWFAAFRYAAWRHSGIALTNNRLFIRGYRRMSLYTSSVSVRHINQIRFLQNPFQRIAKTCTVKICSGSAAQQFFTVRHLALSEAHRLLTLYR